MKLTKSQLKDFIDWEGGIEAAILHGLGDEIKDKKVSELWDETIAAYRPFQEACGKLAEAIGY